MGGNNGCGEGGGCNSRGGRRSSVDGGGSSAVAPPKGVKKILCLFRDGSTNALCLVFH